MKVWKKIMGAIVSSVIEGSIAQELEISKGDEENILIIPKGFKDDIKNSLILKVKEEIIQQKNLETLMKGKKTL